MSTGNGKQSKLSELLEVTNDALKTGDSAEIKEKPLIRWEKIGTAFMTALLTFYFTTLLVVFLILPLTKWLRIK